MERIRLEIVASVQMEAFDVMKLIQDFPFVPEEGECEVEHSAVTRFRQENQAQKAFLNTFVLACDSETIEFLYQKFRSVGLQSFAFEQKNK
jgi:hypothetical protein